MSTKTQTRGHCQCCGRIQSVRGAMSKHGYTVQNGWFSGVCSGHNFAPMETNRAEVDSIVSTVRSQCAELRTNAALVEQGKKFPKFAKVTTDRRTGEKVEVLFEDGESWEKNDAVRTLFWSLTQRAKAGEDFASMLEGIANRVHGQPLMVVKVEAAATRIQAGERRVSARGEIMVAKGQDGARVNWYIQRGEKKLNSWTGTKAWRALALAA